MKPIKKYSILLAVFTLFSILIIFISNAGPKTDPNFSYISGSPNSKYVQVSPDWPIDIPFAFKVSPETVEVELELVDAEKFLQNGIRLKHKTISVINNLATSKAMFDLKEKNAMRPGTYTIKILVKDKETGGVIRTGKIPFIVNMEQIIAKCSC